jgi:glucose/arabinose dehydrogenase
VTVTRKRGTGPAGAGALACVLLASTTALSQDAIPRRFPTPGSAAESPMPQSGPRADAIRRTLEAVRLPPGFRIELFALVPDARHMAVTPSGRTVFVGTRKGRVWAVDVPASGAVPEVRAFAPALPLRLANGVCLAPDGTLYVAEVNRVQAFRSAESAWRGETLEVTEIVPEGRLVPREEESFGHGARVCRVGPDGRLYVSLGQPYNVTPRAKVDLYERSGIGGIVRMNRADGSQREVFVKGARNCVGIEFSPFDGSLWWTDNQVDGMGDDTPPGELNRTVKAGSHHGFPWYGGGRVRTAEHLDSVAPANAIFPEVEMAAHAADLGLAFYTGTAFPRKYRGGIFSAQHGSWNRTEPVGARVMFTSLKADGSADRTEVFAEGWLDPATRSYRGRPVDMAQLPDGSLLVSDDHAGALYRIRHE